MAPSLVPFPMGDLFQTPLRRCATGTTLSRPVHPSCGHLQPSTRHSCRWHDHFSLARFRSPQQETSDDAARRRVLAKIPVARVATWIRPHPLFRLDGSSPPRRIAPALLAAACRIRSVSRSSACGKSRSLVTAALDLSPMRRAHGPYQTTQFHGASMAVSARYRRPTAMTRSLTSPPQHLSPHYHHTCVRVARRGAANLRKYTSRQPVEKPIGNTSSRLPPSSTL